MHHSLTRYPELPVPINDDAVNRGFAPVGKCVRPEVLATSLVRVQIPCAAQQQHTTNNNQKQRQPPSLKTRPRGLSGVGRRPLKAEDSGSNPDEGATGFRSSFTAVHGRVNDGEYLHDLEAFVSGFRDGVCCGGKPRLPLSFLQVGWWD